MSCEVIGFFGNRFVVRMGRSLKQEPQLVLYRFLW